MTNYWQNQARNNGKCSYWNLVDGENLTAEEKVISRFMKRAEIKYECVMLPPMPRLHVARLKNLLPKVRPNVLQALTQCCVLTYTFVPIKECVIGWKDLPLSYEQRHAMWKGTGFKGVSAYADAFIEQSLNQEKPICENLFDLHRQLNIKDFSLEKAYLAFVEKSMKNPDKVTLWNSKHRDAVAFRSQVFDVFPTVRKKFESSHSKIATHQFMMTAFYVNAEKTR